MRRPTSPEQAYRWHSLAVIGQRPPIHDGHPECGWYMRTLKKDGDPVPATIYLEQPIDPQTGELTGPEVMICEVNGQRRNPVDEWTWLARRPISEQQYLDMLGAQLGDLEEPKLAAAETLPPDFGQITDKPGQIGTNPDSPPETSDVVEKIDTPIPPKPPGAKTLF